MQIPAGKATPAPPVGTALGPQGVNIMEFCKAFNAKTSGKDQEGLIIPVVITIFSDRSFTFITKTPPVPVLIKRAVNLAKGSAEPHKTKVGKITEKQVEEIAKIKMPDLNCFDVEAAMRSVQRHGAQHGRGRSGLGGAYWIRGTSHSEIRSGVYSAMVSKSRSLCQSATPFSIAIAAIKESMGERSVRPRRRPSR